MEMASSATGPSGSRSEHLQGRTGVQVLEYALGRREATGSVGEDLAQALADLGAADPTRARGYKWIGSNFVLRMFRTPKLKDVRSGLYRRLS